MVFNREYSVMELTELSKIPIEGSTNFAFSIRVGSHL